MTEHSGDENNDGIGGIKGSFRVKGLLGNKKMTSKQNIRKINLPSSKNSSGSILGNNLLNKISA